MASAKVHFPVSTAVVAAGFVPNMPEALSSRSLMVIVLTLAFGFLIDVDHISSLDKNKIRNGMWIRELNHVNYLHTWEMALSVAMISAAIWNFLPLISYGLHILIDAPNWNNVRCPLPVALLQYVPERLRYIYKFRNK